MQNITYKSIIAALTVSAFMVSCKPKLDAPDPGKGSVDFSKYVSIGNSITSGYADGALYYDGQMVSYPNLLAEQFKQVGGGNFTQPLMPVSSVGAGLAGSTVVSKRVLGYATDCKGVTSLSPVFYAPTGDAAGLTTNIAAQGPFNNMGVPGAKATHIPVQGYGLLNPFFKRMVDPSEVSTASILSKASAQNPTFFSMFIGNNDVLAYALAGGASDAITSSSAFDPSIDAIVNTMTANGAKGVIGNIPDITSLPYFTTIPYNGLTLDATQAAQLSAAYAPLGITFQAGSNPFLIKDPGATGGVRKIKSTEYILLSTPQDSIKCFGYGSQFPLSNKYVLTEAEVSGIQAAVAAYNSKLNAVASAKGLAYVDVNGFMAKAKSGIVYNGVNTSSSFVSGGAFSLDGVHLTPRANAMLANEFIKAINSTYGATVPQVDVTKYKGVVFP